MPGAAIDTAAGTILTLNGVVSGGSLTKTGPGMLVASASNIHTGSTTIAAGVLVAAADASLGAAGGGTIDTNGFDVTYDGISQGSGGLTKLGPGTLTLAGVNMYTGTTNVTDGALELPIGLNRVVATFGRTGGGVFPPEMADGPNVSQYHAR